MKRLVRQYNIDNDYFKVKYGTTNVLNPVVLFIEAKTWLVALNDGDYESEISKIFSRLEKIVKRKVLSSGFNDRFMLNYGLSYLGMTKDRAKSLSISLYVKQNDNHVVSVESLSRKVENIIGDTLNSLLVSLDSQGYMVKKQRGS